VPKTEMARHKLQTHPQLRNGLATAYAKEYAKLVDGTRTQGFRPVFNGERRAKR
jgi:hypothetical protein